MYAVSRDASRMTVRQQQCPGYVIPYFYFAPQSYRFHGDRVTYVSVVNDPVYLADPMDPKPRFHAHGPRPELMALRMRRQCRPYGAANVMRLPGRLHLTWQDDQTLKLETAAGSRRARLYSARQRRQPRRAGKAARVLVAKHCLAVAVRRRSRRRFVTTNLRPGYLRFNGVPYSGNTTITEYFDRVDVPGGDALLIVTTTIEDPHVSDAALSVQHPLKRQKDASGWRPRPCGAR